MAEIKNEWFRDCSGLESIRLDNVKTIRYFAFDNCGKLKSIGNLSRLECVEKYAFAGTTSLNIELSMPSMTGELPDDVFAHSGITKIVNLGKVTSLHGTGPYDRGPFGWCYNLTQVVFPPTLTSIGAWSFQCCYALEWIKVLSATPPTLGDNAFYDTNDDFIIYVPAASVNAYKTAKNWSNLASRIRAIVD